MTDKYMPKNGEPVDLHLSGIVKRRLRENDPYFEIRSEDGLQVTLNLNAGYVVSIEKLPEPEPDWQHGDMIQVEGWDEHLTFNAADSFRESRWYWNISATSEPQEWVSGHWAEGRVRRVKVVPD